MQIRCADAVQTTSPDAETWESEPIAAPRRTGKVLNVSASSPAYLPTLCKGRILSQMHCSGHIGPGNEKAVEEDTAYDSIHTTVQAGK